MKNVTFAQWPLWLILSVVVQNVIYDKCHIKVNYPWRHYAECLSGECRGAFDFDEKVRMKEKANNYQLKKETKKKEMKELKI
jgi:hypothetical protein